MRIILYTGKGGVGKTTVAAATALRAAALGYRIIVFSTDSAHSLGDAFDTPLSGEPKLVAENLWAQEIDLLLDMERYWGTIQDWIVAVMAWRGLDEVIAEEMAVLPGMEELQSLLYVARYHDSGDYDVVIVDCAPTGETLRLLSFPEVAQWWVSRLMPIERRAAQLLRPVARSLFNVPIPDDKVFDSIADLFRQLDRMHRLLTDPQKTSVRLVLNPEKMVIKEAQRTYTYLNLYGYFTDLVICNRIIPEEVDDPYFRAWKEAQAKYFHMIEEGFSPLPIATVPLMNEEVVGIPMLRRVGDILFKEDDPTKIFFEGQAQEIKKVDGHYVLTLALPFISKEGISLMQSGDELIVHIGNRKRNLILPRALLGLKTTEAKLEDNRLRIRFEPEPKG